MPVIANVILRGVSADQYDAVRAGTGHVKRPPDGGFVHVVWWEGDDCHIVDAWESEAAFGAFGAERLGPAMAAAGVAVEPEVTFHPAHEVLAPEVVKLT